MKFNKLIPELTVSDIERSKKFYINVLGFELEYERQENHFAFLSLGEAQLMLDEINGNWDVGELVYPFGRGMNLQIEINNLEQFVAKMKDQGIVPFKDIFCSQYRCDNVTYFEKEVLI